MNSDSPLDPRSALEASLTALLLGELPHDQAAALHQKLAQDVELAALYERLKHTINLVRETVTSPAAETVAQPAPLKLSDERRQKLLQQFKTVAPSQFVRRYPRPRRWLVPVGIAAGLVVLMGTLLLPMFTSRFELMNRVGAESGGDEKEERYAHFAAPAAAAKRVDQDRYWGGATRHYYSDGDTLKKGMPIAPPPPPAPTPPVSLANAIVLPQAGEIPDATATPAPGIAVGQGFAYKKSASGDSSAWVRSFRVDDANGEGGGGGVGGRAGAAATPEPRPTEVANANTFYRQLEAVDALKAGEPEWVGALGKPSTPSTTSGRSSLTRDDVGGLHYLTAPAEQNKSAFVGRYAYGLAPAAAAAAGQQGRNEVVSSVELQNAQPQDVQNALGDLFSRNAGINNNNQPRIVAHNSPLNKRMAPNPSPDTVERLGAAPEPAPPPVADLPATPPVVVAPPQPAPVVATTPSAPVPAPTPTEGASVTTFTAAGLPAVTHGEAVVAGQPSVNRRLSYEWQRGAELLHEQAAPEPRKPAAVTPLPGAVAGDYGGGTYGAYTAAIQAPAGETVNIQNAGDVPVLRQRRLSDGKPAGADQGKAEPSSAEQTAVNEAVLRQAVRSPAKKAGQADTKVGEVAQADRKALGFDWYDGNVLAGNGQIQAQGGTPPPNAGQPPATAEGENAPVLGDVPTTQRFYRLQAGEAGGPAPTTYQWKFNDGNVSSPPSPGAGQEKSKDVELAGNPSLGRQTSVAGAEVLRNQDAGALGGVFHYANPSDISAALQDLSRSDDKAAQEVRSPGAVEGNRGQSISNRSYSLNVVGYSGVPPDQLTNAVTVAPTEPARRSQSQIALPSAKGDTRLALNDRSGANQETRPYFEAKSELAELQRFRQILDAKIAYEKIDTELPKTMNVEIVDKAVPASSPSSSLWDKVRGKGSTYKSTARIKLERDQSDIQGMAERGQTAGYDPYFMQTEEELVRSEAILGKVADALDLKHAWAGKKGSGEKLTTSEAVSLLKQSLDLRPVKNTSLMEIGVKSDKPEEAAKIANAVAEAYKEHRAEQRAQLSRGGITALEDRFKEQQEKVKEAQKKVDDLRAQLNISDATAASDGPSPLMTAETLRKLEQMRIESKAEAVRQTTLLDQLKKVQKDKSPDDLAQVITTVAPDTLLSSLLEQLTMAEQNLVTLEKVYGPKHAEVLKVKDMEEDLHAKIKNRVNGIMLGLETRVLSLSNSLDNLQREVAMATSNDVMVASQTHAYVEAKADLAARKLSASAPIPQPEVQTADNTFSTFSLNVSDVSWKLAAASLEKGVMPEPASVRSEEFINAFDYRDPEPPPGVPVAFAWERARYPFAQGRDLLRFSIKTAALGREPGRPMNIVLLLDNSGSMERADRVQIIREALRVLAGQLQPQDKFSIVTFSRTARLWVDGVPGNQAAKAAEEVSGLTPQGGTNLEEAMNLAYQTALRHYLANGINRVVLLTDGAANLGNVDPEALKQKVETNRKQGIALDCFGIGWEGYNDDLLEVLSRNGDGRYGFINTPEEAATEFAGQLAGALHVAASDVKVQVEFNPARVTAYRQIGYAKHQLTKEQFRDNTVDAAEIGAAESGNALYVIAVNPAGDGPLATVRARYRVPGTSDYHEHEWPVPYTGNAVGLEQASPAMRLAATASAFSEWLVSSPYAAEVNPDFLLGYLRGLPEVYGADARPKKLEWMIRQAKSIAGK